jgi:hypothetical protein
MQEYKSRSGRMFPTWSEILEVLRALGYRKLPVRPRQIPADAPEDQEPPSLRGRGRPAVSKRSSKKA